MIIKIYITLNELKTAVINQPNIYDNFKFLNFKNLVKINTVAIYPELYVTMWDNDIFCGIMKVICLNDYLNYPNYFRTCMYISVHQSYKHQGIAKKLIDVYFNFCEMNHINDILYLSPYTNDGRQYLKHIFDNKYKQLVNESFNTFIG